MYNIEQYAFCNVTSLEYFDFENCAVIYIGSYAFRNLGKLEYIGTFGESLESVGQRAFNQSLTAPPKTTIRIPSTVQSIGTHGFSMLKIGGNCSLEIGLPQKQSELVFTSNGSNEFMMGDENKYSSVTFYSNYYETDDAFATSRLSSASNGNISVI